MTSKIDDGVSLNDSLHTDDSGEKVGLVQPKGTIHISDASTEKEKMSYASQQPMRTEGASPSNNS